MALKKIVDDFKQAAGDLSSLSVETYSGEITADIVSADGDKRELKWDQIIAKGLDGDASGTVNLKLASKYHFDGDATLFIADSDILPDVREAHDAAVESGQSVRKDLMDLLGEVIRKNL